MAKLVTLLLTISLSMEAFATSCPKPVQLINEGQTANCKGYLFSEEEESKLYLQDQDYLLLKKEIELYSLQIKSYQSSMENFNTILKEEQDKTQLWKTAAENSTSKLVNLEEKTWKRDLTAFGFGILTVVLSAWTIKQLK